jgi:multidrug efflux pump subunit AcrA (membrane-fusion protein)
VAAGEQSSELSLKSGPVLVPEDEIVELVLAEQKQQEEQAALEQQQQQRRARAVSAEDRGVVAEWLRDCQLFREALHVEATIADLDRLVRLSGGSAPAACWNLAVLDARGKVFADLDEVTQAVASVQHREARARRELYAALTRPAGGLQLFRRIPVPGTTTSRPVAVPSPADVDRLFYESKVRLFPC